MQQCTVDHPGLLWFAERRSVSKGLLQQCLHHLSLSFFPLLGMSDKRPIVSPILQLPVTTAETVEIGAGQLKRNLCSLHGRASASGPTQCDQVAQSHRVQPRHSQESLMSPSAQPPGAVP